VAPPCGREALCALATERWRTVVVRDHRTAPERKPGPAVGGCGARLHYLALPAVRTPPERPSGPSAG
jgi:hypothetical protein